MRVRQPVVQPVVQPLEGRRLLAVDLTGNFSAVREKFGPGVPIQGSFTILNEGSTPTGAPVPYRVTLVTTNVYDPDNIFAVLDTGTLPAIGADDQRSQSFSYPVQDAWLGKTLFIHLSLDLDDQIAESDEQNNENGARVRIATALVGTDLVGTAGRDVFFVEEEDGYVFVGDGSGGGSEETGYLSGFAVAPLAAVPSLSFDMGAGDDSLFMLVTTDIPVSVLGGDGDDDINTAGGNDTIDSGAGDDHVWSFAGNDAVVAGGGRDTVRAGAGDDHVKGNAGGDYLVGGEGNDTLVGNGGNDRLRGSQGDDKLLGGAGNDRLDHPVSPGLDTLTGHAGQDTAYGDAADVLYAVETRRLTLIG